MLINVKRKLDWDEKEESEKEDFTDEESDEEELLIKDVLGNLSQAVSRKRAQGPKLTFEVGCPLDNHLFRSRRPR